MSGVEAYYDQNAEAYAERTRSIDVSSLRERFLGHVPPGGHILDVGPGSGRDMAAFVSAGFRVRGLDSSSGLAAIAAAHSGGPVTVGDVRDLDDVDAYDGVWASASLLHLEEQEIADVLGRLEHSMVQGGVLFLSFKVGGVDGPDTDGRPFTYVDVGRLQDLLPEGLTLFWFEYSGSLDGRDQQWLVALLRKDPPASRWLSILRAILGVDDHNPYAHGPGFLPPSGW